MALECAIGTRVPTFALLIARRSRVRIPPPLFKDPLEIRGFFCCLWSRLPGRAGSMLGSKFAKAWPGCGSVSLRWADALEESPWGLDEYARALQVGQVSIAGNEHVDACDDRELKEVVVLLIP